MFVVSRNGFLFFIGKIKGNECMDHLMVSDHHHLRSRGVPELNVEQMELKDENQNCVFVRVESKAIYFSKMILVLSQF